MNEVEDGSPPKNEMKNNNHAYHNRRQHHHRRHNHHRRRHMGDQSAGELFLDREILRRYEGATTLKLPKRRENIHLYVQDVCQNMEMHLQGAKISVKNPFRVGDFVLGDKGKVRIKDYYFQEQDYLGLVNEVYETSTKITFLASTSNVPKENNLLALVTTKEKLPEDLRGRHWNFCKLLRLMFYWSGKDELTTIEICDAISFFNGRPPREDFPLSQKQGMKYNDIRFNRGTWLHKRLAEVRLQFSPQEAIELVYSRFGLPLFPIIELQNLLDLFFPLQQHFNHAIGQPLLHPCCPPGFVEVEIQQVRYLVKVGTSSAIFQNAVNFVFTLTQKTFWHPLVEQLFNISRSEYEANAHLLPLPNLASIFQPYEKRPRASDLKRHLHRRVPSITSSSSNSTSTRPSPRSIAESPHGLHLDHSRHKRVNSRQRSFRIGTPLKDPPKFIPVPMALHPSTVEIFSYPRKIPHVGEQLFFQDHYCTIIDVQVRHNQCLVKSGDLRFHLTLEQAQQCRVADEHEFCTLEDDLRRYNGFLTYLYGKKQFCVTCLHSNNKQYVPISEVSRIKHYEDATVNSNAFRFALIFYVAKRPVISIEDFKNAHEYLFLRPIRELKSCQVFEIREDDVHLIIPLKNINIDLPQSLKEQLILYTIFGTYHRESYVPFGAAARIVNRVFNLKPSDLEFLVQKHALLNKQYRLEVHTNVRFIFSEKRTPSLPQYLYYNNNFKLFVYCKIEGKEYPVKCQVECCKESKLVVKKPKNPERSHEVVCFDLTQSMKLTDAISTLFLSARRAWMSTKEFLRNWKYLGRQPLRFSDEYLQQPMEGLNQDGSQVRFQKEYFYKVHKYAERSYLYCFQTQFFDPCIVIALEPINFKLYGDLLYTVEFPEGRRESVEEWRLLQIPKDDPFSAEENFHAYVRQNFHAATRESMVPRTLNNPIGQIFPSPSITPRLSAVSAERPSLFDDLPHASTTPSPMTSPNLSNKRDPTKDFFSKPSPQSSPFHTSSSPFHQPSPSHSSSLFSQPKTPTKSSNIHEDFEDFVNTFNHDNTSFSRDDLRFNSRFDTRTEPHLEDSFERTIQTSPILRNVHSPGSRFFSEDVHSRSPYSSNNSISSSLHSFSHDNFNLTRTYREEEAGSVFLNSKDLFSSKPRNNKESLFSPKLEVPFHPQSAMTHASASSSNGRNDPWATSFS